MGNSGLKQHFEAARKTGVLKVSGQKLHEFPPALKHLDGMLRTLDISENRFAVIPSEIGQFEILKHLNVSRSGLTELPECLAELIGLESLNAGCNHIVALPSSLSNLDHLRQVNLSENQLKEFPTVFCGLKHLDVLDLSKNKIALVPSEVLNLHVTELNLNQNRVSGVSPQVSGCPGLKALRLEEGCLQLTGIHPKTLEESRVSMLALEGNLFEMKQFTELDGYEEYMERYTAVGRKVF